MPGNALLTVYDKTGLDRLAWIFSKLQIKMLGSGGTAEAVRKLGFHVVEVSEHTQVSETPGGLVKARHPRLQRGLLAGRRHAHRRTTQAARRITHALAKVVT